MQKFQNIEKTKVKAIINQLHVSAYFHIFTSVDIHSSPIFKPKQAQCPHRVHRVLCLAFPGNVTSRTSLTRNYFSSVTSRRSCLPPLPLARPLALSPSWPGPEAQPMRTALRFCRHSSSSMGQGCDWVMAVLGPPLSTATPPYRNTLELLNQGV